MTSRHAATSLKTSVVSYPRGASRLLVAALAAAVVAAAVPAETRQAAPPTTKASDDVLVVAAPAPARPVVLPGATTLDPLRVLRVRAPFAPAEVTEVGKSKVGDRVKKGDVLAVLSSVDVGSKKNDLYDALERLKLDEVILDRIEKARGSVPEVLLLNTRRNIVADRQAVARAENALRNLKILEEDIQAVRKEAGKAGVGPAKGDKKARDEEREKLRQERLKRWGRVELKAPRDAVLVERNVSPHEIFIDAKTDLFTLARLDRLGVIANAPEDYAAKLRALPEDKRCWTVKTAGAPAGGVQGRIETIGSLVDPREHTVLLRGTIDNAGGLLRAGQFVTCTIQVPPPGGVVEVPLGAVVQAGRYSIVFVQPDPDRPRYVPRRVQVTHRFDKTAFVRATPIAQDDRLTAAEGEQGLQPVEPLRPGERVAKNAALRLQAALLAPEARPAAANAKARLGAAQAVYKGLLARRRSDPNFQASLERLYHWSLRWGAAQAEGGTKKDRLAAAEAHLARMRELENQTREQRKKGMAAAYEVSEAEFFRLAAENRLGALKKE
jgi:cobalt-zinc-cadmium efflux system membrane fusion protein